MVERTETLKNKITKRTTLMYTIIFFALIILIYSLFYFTNNSFIWDGDGLSQHFQLFYDFADKIQGIFRGEGFPLWDWSIGLGADVFSSYGYYIIGDPFAYLGALFPEALRELGFHLLIFLRMWCVGGSFLLYAKKIDFSHKAGLLGSVMYAFSHFVIYNVTRHQFFILPMIWLPLLLLGVEKILRKESGVLFSLMVALSAVANFYFFYKLTILVLMYGVIRYASFYSFRDWKFLLKMFWRCLYLYLIGVVISAVIFMPVVFGFLNGSRSASGLEINLLVYPLQYYYLLFLNLLTPGTYLWTVGGFSVFALLAFFFLWRRRKTYSFVLIALLILGILLLTPFFGSIMNGFSGPYNRFTFAFPFYFALASGIFLEKRYQLVEKDLKLMRNFLIFFSIFYLFPMFVLQTYLLYILPMVIGWIIWALLKYENNSIGTIEWMSNALIGLVILNLGTNAFMFYHPQGKDAIGDTMPWGESEESYQNALGGLEHYLPDDSVCRTGVTSRDNHIKNQFIYLDEMGLNSYLSITDGDIADFAREMEVGSFQLIQPLRNGFDDRRIPNHFFGVRYIITEADNEAYLPFGYDVVHEENGYIIAETDNAYPFAYVEDTYLPSSQFTALNPAEKDAYLAEGVVLEDDHSISGLQEFNGDLPVETVPFEIESVDPTIERTGENTFEVTEEDSQITLSVNPEDLAGTDVYVHMQGLDFEPYNQIPLITEDTSNRNRVYFGDQEKSILQSDIYTFSSYFKRNNMLFHMGHTENGEETVTIQFDDDGRYEMNEIELYALEANAEEDAQQAQEKQANAMDITTFENERVEGTVSRDTPGLLVTSIPDSLGWEVTVNGEAVEPVKTNIGFMGVPVEAGESEVVFTYQTPLLKAGSVVTIIGFALLAIVEFRFKRKNKNNS